MSTMILLLPMPIHGGFTLVGDMLIDEFRGLHEKHHENSKKNRQIESYSRLEERFAGQLEIDAQNRNRNGWQNVILRGNRPAWFDPSSGLIWSESERLYGESTTLGIETAKTYCRDYLPAGFWALPTEAEQALMWQATGGSKSAGSEASEISYLVDGDLIQEMPVFRVHGHRNDARAAGGTTSIRCVARGPGSPPGGYTQSDIPLDLWNRYQLSKLAAHKG
ncbi:MAG: hypothetical protein ACU843_08820 [Gammaproteobacteria bacterium]